MLFKASLVALATQLLGAVAQVRLACQEDSLVLDCHPTQPIGFQ